MNPIIDNNRQMLLVASGTSFEAKTKTLLNRPSLFTYSAAKNALNSLFAVVFAIALLFSQSTASSIFEQKRSISTSFGVLRGTSMLFRSSDSIVSDRLPAVTQYLGIPYGLSPTGQYRFNIAISAAKWVHQIKDAFRFSASCVQSGLPDQSESEAFKQTSSQRFDRVHKMLPFLNPQSEDCLYLNMFVPEPISTSTGSVQPPPPFPVLVVVHGSDYGWGGASAHNASILAAFGQIVVVTLNYRLGIYGFLGKCEAEMNSCTGNAGLSDVVAALKMLSNILPAFGADPTAITLLGWGSGAALISLLMASPITQPTTSRLFRRAILLDGSALSPWAMVSNPQEYFMRVATDLSCRTQDSAKKDYLQREMARILRCLQEHSAQNLTAAAKRVQAPTFLSAFGPIVDGQIVPNHPRFSFGPKFGALFRDIDLMLGTVSHPAHHLLPNADAEHGISQERRDKMLRTVTRNLFDYHRGEIFHAILNEYTDWDNPRDHPRALRNNLLAALGDLLYITPLIETARMHATDEFPKASNTFFFVLGHETGSWTREQPMSGLRGALSDDHVPYILGYPLLDLDNTGSGNIAQIYGGGFTVDDKAISRVLMTYISNFVRSGDPSKPRAMSTENTIEDRFHGTPWPQFSQATREAYLEITDRPRVKNYYRNSFVSFWTGFIPELNKGSKRVPEEHNFLIDHFNRQSFFGTVRPYSTFHNDPFPPPPLPPTPFPKEAKKQQTTGSPSDTKRPPSGEDGSGEKASAASPETTGDDAFKAQYQQLGIIVAVGAAFLVLHLCIYVAMLRLCYGNRREKKLKYQSYAMDHAPPPGLDLNFSNTSLGMGHQYLSAPPKRSIDADLAEFPAEVKRTSGFDTMNHQNKNNNNGSVRNSSKMSAHMFGKNSPVGGYVTSTAITHQNCDDRTATTTTMLSRRTSSLREQEPLLLSKNAVQTPGSGLVRLSGAGTGPGLGTGISPTCPRHGRAAQMMIATNRGGGMTSTGQSTTSSGGNGNRVDSPPYQQMNITTTGILPPPITLEEVQV